MKKDKQKVIDEVWTEERVRGFLDLQPPERFDPDFHRLRRAYQSMRPEDFILFLEMFVAAGMNINALSPEGQTLIAEISGHRMATPFIDALRQAGATE